MIESPDLEFIPDGPAGCLSRFRLERYLAGELEGLERSQLAEHLRGCALCQGLRASLEAEKVGFQATISFDEFLERLTPASPHPVAAPGRGSRAEVPDRFVAALREFLRWLANPAMVGLAVVALALIVLVPRLYEASTDSGGSGATDPLTGRPEREKGLREPGPLEVAVLRGSQVLVGVSGSIFYEGDRLQFTVHPGSRRYLQLFSLEANGRVSPFYPDGARESVRLGPDAEQPLAGSIRLDNYAGLERIFALFSDVPIDERLIEAAVARLVRQQGLPLALDRLAVLPMPASPATSQVSFLMVKE